MQWKFEAEAKTKLSLSGRGLYVVRSREERLEMANLIALKKEEKHRKFQATGDARFASEQIELSKERNAHAERFQKENEILAVSECDQ